MSDDITVLVADDQEPFRRMVREVLTDVSGFMLVGEVASGEEVPAAVEALSPDLVLMDVHMPGRGGIPAAREVTRSYPHVVVVLMSVDTADALPAEVRTCGAKAFLCKQDLCPRTLRTIWETRR